MNEVSEALDCERFEEMDHVDLGEDEAVCVAGGPQEQNIPPR